MTSAGCRYEVDLYIFFENDVGSIHTEQNSALLYFLIEVGNILLTGKQIVTSQMQFYINFYYFFSGIPDHNSVKLCYSRSQLFLILLLLSGYC